MQFAGALANKEILVREASAAFFSYSVRLSLTGSAFM